MADWGDKRDGVMEARNVLHGGPPMSYTDEELDRMVEVWHSAQPGSAAFSHHLHEFLGMSWEEYVARFGPVAVRQAAAEDRAAGEAHCG